MVGQGSPLRGLCTQAGCRWGALALALALVVWAVVAVGCGVHQAGGGLEDQVHLEGVLAVGLVVSSNRRKHTDK